MNKLLKYLAVMALFALLTVTGYCQAADPEAITTAATTAFEAVTVLVVAMVSFFIIVRIVKGIRK